MISRDKKNTIIIICKEIHIFSIFFFHNFILLIIIFLIYIIIRNKKIIFQFCYFTNFVTTYLNLSNYLDVDKYNSKVNKVRYIYVTSHLFNKPKLKEVSHKYNSAIKEFKT